MDHVTLARLASRALRRSMAESLYLNSGINLTKPNDIRATLTERCNFRCVYCDHWRQDSYADELTLEQWQAALQSIRDYVGRFAVQFLGGEPMLMPWFFELAAFCHATGIDWGVVTNGSSLSADRVARLVAAMPLNIDVSIDSRGEAVNDRLRGWKGAMRRTAAGITALAAAREAAGARFPIRVKTVVSRDNIDDLDELVAWAASMPGVTIDLSPV